MTPTRPTRAEISLDALRHNFAVARALAGPARVMAVVKAEAYGHGLIRMAQVFAALGADGLGVSFLEEGVALRKAGLELPILVMGGLVDEQVSDYLDYSLTPTVSSVWKARQVDYAAASRGVKARAHIKVDTGMGRVGQQWHSAGQLFNALGKLRHLEPEGIYTHFASAEADDLTFARAQLERFGEVILTAHRMGLEFPVVHCANSGALVQMTDESRFDLVRPGILLYGYAPSASLASRVDLQPAMRLVTRVVYVKRPPVGAPAGYGSTWTSPGDRWIATLPIGYGDGYPRRAGNRAEVIMRNRRCLVVGNVSMDQITVDAGPDAYLGDDVLLFGRSGDAELPLWNFCRTVDAIPYEVLCGLTARVPRVYLDD